MSETHAQGSSEEFTQTASPAVAHNAVISWDDSAFLSAAGGWSDVDTDAFLDMIYESRKSSRPPVEL